MNIEYKILNEIIKEIKKLKESGYSEKEVRRFINKSFVKAFFKDKEKFCYLGNIKEAIAQILKDVKKIIDNEFYAQLNNKFYAPKITNIDVDTAYTVKRLEKVNEVEFADVDKVVGKSFAIDIDTEGRACEIHQEFTPDGKMIFSCEDTSLKEEKDK